MCAMIIFLKYLRYLDIVLIQVLISMLQINAVSAPLLRISAGEFEIFLLRVS